MLAIAATGLVTGSAVAGATGASPAATDRAHTCNTPYFEEWEFVSSDAPATGIRTRDEAASEFVALALRTSAPEIAAQYVDLTPVNRDFGVELRRGNSVVVYVNVDSERGGRLKSALVCLTGIPAERAIVTSEVPYDR